MLRSQFRWPLYTAPLDTLFWAKSCATSGAHDQTYYVFRSPAYLIINNPETVSSMGSDFIVLGGNEIGTKCLRGYMDVRHAMSSPFDTPPGSPL